MSDKIRPVRIRYDKEGNFYYIPSPKLIITFPVGMSKVDVMALVMKKFSKKLKPKDYPKINYSDVEKFISTPYNFKKAIPITEATNILSSIQSKYKPIKLKKPTYVPRKQYFAIQNNDKKIVETKKVINELTEKKIESDKLDLKKLSEEEHKKQAQEEKRLNEERKKQEQEEKKLEEERKKQMEKEKLLELKNKLLDDISNKQQFRHAYQSLRYRIDKINKELGLKAHLIPEDTQNKAEIKKLKRYKTIVSEIKPFFPSGYNLVDINKSFQEAKSIKEQLDKDEEELSKIKEEEKKLDDVKVEEVKVEDPIVVKQEIPLQGGNKALLDDIDMGGCGYYIQLSDRNKPEYKTFNRTMSKMPDEIKEKVKEEIIAYGKNKVKLDKEDDKYPGLYSTDLDKMMEGEKNFFGSIGEEDIKNLPKINFGGVFICYEEHWYLLFINLPELYIGIYDSYGEPIPKAILKSVKLYVENTLKPKHFLKLKTNDIKMQRITNNNCGMYVVLVLKDLLNGYDWPESTRYDRKTAVKLVEGFVNDERSKYNEEKKEFSYI